MPVTHTFEYSVASNGPGKPDSHIELDVLLPTAEAWSRLNAQHARTEIPVVVWWHGGGTLQGTRKALAKHLAEAPDKYGLILVSPDYRLCPQTTLIGGVLPDAHAAVQWSKTQLPIQLSTLASYLPAPCALPVLSGSSAGGFIAYLVGLPLRIPNVPHAQSKALVGIYPITDLQADFFAKPVEVPFRGRQFQEKDKPIYEAMQDPNGPILTFTEGTPQTNPRFDFYMWAQVTGSWHTLLFNDTQRAQGYVQSTSIPSVLAALDASSTKHIPPVFSVHGTKDTAVDVLQSTELVRVLKEKGVEVQYEERQGIDHLFDQFDPQEDMTQMWSFVLKQFEVPLPAA